MYSHAHVLMLVHLQMCVAKQHYSNIEVILGWFTDQVAESILVLVFNTIVFFLTIAKTWKLFKDLRVTTKHWNDTFTAVVIRDGLFHHSHGISI